MRAKAPAVLADPVLAIRGARVHNLKNIDVDIPHNKLTIVTGVSGSGKSSLVFDTIYAEGQRRYVESLSAYARQFLERMEKPDVDEILGIAPPIAIRQKNQTKNPRSTVATATELYDFIRLLFARAGRTYCPNDGTRIQRDTVDQVAEAMLSQPDGSRWYALFPVSTKAKNNEAAALRDHLFDLRKKGFNRLFQAGRTFEFSTPESLLDIDFSKPLFILVDRIVIRNDLHQRLVDTVEICYRETGEVFFEQAGAADPRILHFSERYACKTCGLSAAIPEPTLFSFNNPIGACPVCQGFGRTIDYDLDLIVPDPTLSLEEGAVDPWTKPQYSWYYEEDLKPKARGKIRLTTPYTDLKPEEKEFLRSHIHRFFREVEKKKYKVHVRVFLSRYRAYTECPSCRGARLRPEALWIRLGDCNIARVCRMNIAQAQDFFQTLELSPEESEIAEKVLDEIRQRCRFLNDVGLEYLTLDRLSATLSGGEAQRIQLATCLGSRLVGTTYVLDEPSIGLHSRDTARLIRILKNLRELGNTIIVVEHDPEVMLEADHILDLGPGAGESGGRVIFDGSYQQLLQPIPSKEPKELQSLTGRYLRGELSVSRAGERRKINPKKTIRFIGCRANNLKNIDVEIPLGVLAAVTGVSGSGKSSLVHDVIYQALDQQVNKERQPAKEESEDPSSARKLALKRTERANLLTSVVMVDQSPIGRTPRSNPVTYIKAFDLIRDLFASTPEAERRGYAAGHFSFNVPGGRCESCQGDGTVTVEMQFLADVQLVCEECKGTRYKASVLDVRYKSLNIHEVLQLTVREALSLFSDTPRLAARLKVLQDVGLGYLRLGQSATTLSGGEAQRVKLAAHLAQSTCTGTLFLFDEPTTGLHFDDIAKLLQAFERLIHNGGSILLIEHNLELIRAADWIIDLGPEGGEAGGHIIAQGTPEAIADVENSYTGQYLKQLLTQRAIA
jgi:excinuclease ABC subunit A